MADGTRYVHGNYPDFFINYGKGRRGSTGALAAIFQLVPGSVRALPSRLIRLVGNFRSYLHAAPSKMTMNSPGFGSLGQFDGLPY
jgi:hypothetical protein